MSDNTKQFEGHYIPNKEVPPEETAQALRNKFREKNKECESLKLELQKLNDYISASEQFNATQSQSYRDTISKQKLDLQKQKELKDELVEALQELNSYAPDFPEYPNSLSVFDLGLQSASKNASSILEKVLKIKP